MSLCFYSLWRLPPTIDVQFNVLCYLLNDICVLNKEKKLKTGSSKGGGASAAHVQ